MNLFLKRNLYYIIYIIFIDVYNFLYANAIEEKRSLVFPPQTSWAATKVQVIAGVGLPMDEYVSTIIGYVVKFNYLLPSNVSELVDPYVRYERSIQDKINSASDINNFDVNGSISRWKIYRMIEMFLDNYYSGKSCLLKVICETASVPFLTTRGILPQILQTFFTPSTTEEKYLDTSDQEYYAAEIAGKKNPGDCAKIFHECEENILDYFTEITFD